MNTSELDTIVAQTTSPGYGGVAIVRISGSNTKQIAQQLLNFVPKPRYATHCDFNNIDVGIALYFPSPNSFTGEDILELHCHGGPVIVDQLIQTVLELGARLANPGEFSERAFLNGKLDLTQAEAIADLINASSRQAAHSALLSLQGEFSKLINSITQELLHLRVETEAGIDFAEENIEFISPAERKKKITVILSQLTQVQAQAAQGSLLREGIRIVIAGAPNVGKSSLLNYFAGKNSAIVTNIPGTTRDVIREFINIDGLPLHLIDTAGIRSSSDSIEKEGIKRTQREMELADYILLLTDQDELDLTPYQQHLSKIIVVRNKIDLIDRAPIPERAQRAAPVNKYTPSSPIQYISIKTEQGLNELKKFLKHQCGFQQNIEGTFLARRRHLMAIEKAVSCLKSALQNQATELIAEDLRLAQIALGEITGEVYTEDLLGKIFSEFCLGK